MRYTKIIGLLALIPLFMLLAGCPDPKAIRDGDDMGGSQGSDGSTRSGIEGQDGLEGQALGGDAKDLLSQRVIYFDFDSNTVRPEYLDVIAAHGRQLAANPAMKLRVEGHADERGTREYNVGLSERRAQAVERLLTFQGAGRQQLETVSYGEEQPAAFGHDDAAWSKNRRVELIYER